MILPPRPRGAAGRLIQEDLCLLTPGAVLFTIRTQQVPLATLTEVPEVAHALAAAIASWSPALAAYKGYHGALAARQWLETP